MVEKKPSAEWVTEEEARAVAKLLECLKQDQGMPLGDLAEALGIPHSEARALLCAVRGGEDVPRVHRRGVLARAWHFSVGVVSIYLALVLFGELWLTITTLNRRHLIDGSLLWLSLGWVVLAAYYYRHVLSRWLRRFGEGFQP